ncbi:hypothetical protein [Cellulomonas sp. S1-8]|uniref:hypothetical protein n=1 Tax=Cellulomonas sp. S1-8 TaxID=2904790 RepID=UPI00224435A2|nr:hypothetical protein [Cellulomonas sp. S1-8]UZN03892.1 hypothetical protein OKX07_02825 [Cellulomonas sp. S1-8]
MRSSLREGVLNLRDGATLGVTLVALVATMIAGAVMLDVVTATRVVRAEQEYLDAGGDLLVAISSGDRPVDVPACLALQGARGVRAVAAVSVRPGAAQIVGRPESSQTLVTATAGVLDLLGVPKLAATEVVASQAIADRWQWTVGSHLQLDRVAAARLGAPAGVLTVGAVADLGLLSEGASTGVLAISPPTGTADGCWVRIGPQYREDLHAAIPAVLGETGTTSVTVADRLPAGPLAQDPAAAFAGRTTRWAGAAAGALVGLVWCLVAWTRRGRAALYASLGVPWSGGVLIRWTEGACVVVVGTLWGVALGTTGAVVLTGAPPSLALDLALRAGAVALCLSLTLVVAIGLWRPPTLAALKDR